MSRAVAVATRDGSEFCTTIISTDIYIMSYAPSADKRESSAGIAWRASQSSPCQICGRTSGCSRTADGLTFCLDSTNTSRDPAYRYLGEASGDSTFGLYRQTGDAVPDRPRTSAEERRHDRHEKYDEFIAGDGAGLAPAEPGSPAWDRLRETFPTFSAETLGQLDCVSSPDLYHGAIGFVERDGSGQPVGVAFRLHGGAKLSRGSRGVTIPKSLLNATPDADPPAVQPPAVLIVEGASDVLACLDMGILAIGRPSNTGGAADLADFVRSHLPRWRWDFLVLGENDRKDDGRWPGRDGMMKVAKKLADLLGIAVRRALPPSGAKDVRDWLKAQSKRKGQPSPATLGHELLSHVLTSAEAVQPSPQKPPVIPSKADPPTSSPPVPIRSGPAAYVEPAFSIGLPEEERCACPFAVTRTLRRVDNHDDVRTASLRCRKMTCDPCRRHNTREYLGRAEAGIRADVAEGGRLALFDGDGVTRTAMCKRLSAEDVSLGGYVQCHLGQRRIVVCTVSPGSAVPAGFVEAGPAEAAAKLREVDALLEHATPFEDAERFRPLSLSRSWGSVSLQKKQGREEQTNAPAPKYEPVITAHAASDPRVFAEYARSKGLDPLFHPRRHGRFLWTMTYSLARLTAEQKRDFWDGLADLRDSDPVAFDQGDDAMPDAEPIAVGGIELGRVEAALFARAKAAGRLGKLPLWLPVSSCKVLADACRAAGILVADQAAA